MDIEEVTYTKFRMGLASFINQVVKTKNPLIITRRKNKPTYLISEDLYKKCVEPKINKLKKSNQRVVGKQSDFLNVHVQDSKSAQQDFFL